MSASTSARERVRAQLTQEIADTARRHLAASGAAGLSLRAVARELDMASSAVYRYFPSRDDLLTTLIVDAYERLGAAVQRADAARDRADFAGRWRAVAVAARTWAADAPHEYMLIYGTPVPGYTAPQHTVRSAARIAVVVASVFVDAAVAGRLSAVSPLPTGDTGTATTAELAALVSWMPDFEAGGLSEQRLADAMRRGLLAWTYLLGAVGFELSGQFAMLTDMEAYFTGNVDLLGGALGLEAADRPA